MTGLKGKSVLVTGAAGGIGRAVVARFAAEGATVAGVDLLSSDADVSITGDLSDPGFCDSLPEQARAAMGKLDILINNAGVRLVAGPL